MDFRELHKMVALYAKARRPQMTAEAKAWRHEFLSWKSIKHFLEHNLHDQNVRDILRTYVPHDATLKFDGTMGMYILIHNWAKSCVKLHLIFLLINKDTVPNFLINLVICTYLLCTFKEKKK